MSDAAKNLEVRSMLYLLNTLMVPIDFSKHSHVTVKFRKISIEEAKLLLAQQFISAVGHEATAKVLSQILSVQVPFNRVSVYLNPGDKAIHFFLRTRLPEGQVLGENELKSLDYWLVLSEVV
jgi:hypothetical protein